MPDDYNYQKAVIGQTVKFPCPTKLDEDVDWVHLKTLESKGEYIYLGNFGIISFNRHPRFKVDEDHSHTLVIYNVTVNDSAYYNKQQQQIYFQ